MSMLYPDVAKLLQVNPRWTGFDDCAFVCQVLPLSTVLDSFLTCWNVPGRAPGTMTLDAYLEASGGPNKKVDTLANEFALERPVLALCFSKNVLHARWSDKYPDGGAQRVVIDANHRLSALAVRRARGQKDDVVVGVFVCD